MRTLTIAAASLLAGGLLLVAVGSSVAPLSRTCAPALPEVACASAVDAVMRRGLADLHPLILAAHVEPGAAPRPDQLGHRATVRFDLLGALRPLSIELHFDEGAHWGGVPDIGDAELALYALAPLIVAGVAVAAAMGVARWRRRGAASARARG